MHPSNTSKNTSPLRTERLQRHWSQRELAERIGATVATVKRWERHATIPGPYFRLKLIALFGKSEEALGLKEAPSPPVPPTAIEAITNSPLWTVPYQRNPYFTGRDELFRLLDECLAATDQEETSRTRRVALTQTRALTGLGGIGKTQLAIEYAYRAHEQGTYTHTFWVNAASEEAIVTSFISFATLLPAFAATHETDQQKLVNAIKQWLEECSDPWLLIFDNADDLSSIQHYFPRYGNGSILLTTRVHAVGSLATSIAVEKMGLTEGTSLLLRRAQRLAQTSNDEIKAAENLVVALDYFPLALEQAGAYIEETGCSFDTYLHLYRTHRRALLTRRGAQATNYPDSVATTWLLSFQKVKHANPAAAQLLQLCAFLAPDSIPEELLKEGAMYWPVLLQQAVADPFTYNQLLEALLRFSLVKRLAEDHVLSIHRLVQVVQAEMIAPEEQRQWAERIVRAVNDLFPRQPQEDVHSWPQCLRYLEQVQVCAMLIEQHQLRLPEAADVLDRAGIYLSIHASYSLAEALHQHALRLREQLLGMHHPETARSLHNLGFLSFVQGKYKLAERYYQQALCIREEQLGVQHLETSKTLNNLGILYGEQGKYQLAESYWQRVLALNEEQLGTQHPFLGTILENLSILYSKQGQYQLAESYQQRALAILEEQLGVDHSETDEILYYLSILYGEQGKYQLAEAHGQRALAILEARLGTCHPMTARALENLGRLSYKQERHEQAEAHGQRALVILEARLGTRHPMTARALENLGRLSYKQERHEQAEHYYQRALAIKEEQLGTRHPMTARTLNYLAELYRDQHKYEQAKLLFVRTLEIQEHALTANHPDLATTLHGFARFHEDLGSLQTAATLYQRALTIREQVYDLHHYKTRETRENLQRVLLLLKNEEKEMQQDIQSLEQADIK